jgi:hypothetical protein
MTCSLCSFVWVRILARVAELASTWYALKTNERFEFFHAGTHEGLATACVSRGIGFELLVEHLYFESTETLMKKAALTTFEGSSSLFPLNLNDKLSRFAFQSSFTVGARFRIIMRLKPLNFSLCIYNVFARERKKVKIHFAKFVSSFITPVHCAFIIFHIPLILIVIVLKMFHCAFGTLNFSPHSLDYSLRYRILYRMLIFLLLILTNR